jgi:hypothetical protein
LKFALFVEGATERGAIGDFLKRWLDPRVASPIGLRVVKFKGWSHYVEEIRTKVDLNLSGNAGAEIIAGIGLLDLYGPTFYPSHMHTVVQKYTWAKQHLETLVGHQRFRQHFAVHETEAWLLSDPTSLPRAVRERLPARAVTPEQVNFNEPPATLLDRLYRQGLNRAYRKVIDGKNLFLDLDPNSAYGKCPYLKLLLDDLAALSPAP